MGPKRGEEECSEGTREQATVSTMEKPTRGGIAAPNTSEEGRQEPGQETPGTEKKAKSICSKKRRGKRAVRKPVRKKHKSTRARSRLEELTFGTFNVRTAAINGIVHIDTLLRTCAAKGCDVIGLQETKRDGILEILASGYRVLSVGIVAWIRAGKGSMGLDWR